MYAPDKECAEDEPTSRSLLYNGRNNNAEVSYREGLLDKINELDDKDHGHSLLLSDSF